MKSVGVLATALGMALVAGAAVLVIRSIPEIRRYMKISSM
jgi:hypothetical protein